MSNLSEAIEVYKASFPFYAKECLKIKTKDGLRIPFTLNRAQKRFWDMIFEDLKAGRPVRYIILKARQLGISTLIEAILFWLTSLNKNRGAVIVAHSVDSVSNLFDKEKIFLSELPQPLKPMVKACNESEIHFANPKQDGMLGLESKILIDTAKNADIGRSFTIQAAHLSEFGFWDGLGYEPSVRLNSINQAIPEKAGTFVFIESTANGESYFKQLWDKDDPKYTLKKVFISWVSDDDYTLPINPLNHFELDDNPESPYGDEETEFKYISEQLKLWYPELDDNQHYLEIFNRLNWRRHYIDNKCEGKVTLFQQEYPTIPEQAFLYSSANLFDLRQLQAMKKHAVEPSIFRFDNGIADKLKQINITNYDAVKAICSRAFELTSSSYGLRVYEHPRKGISYCIGSDTSEGVRGGDLSACVVLRCPELIEVATFNQIIDPYEYALILYALGFVYNKALLGVEDNDKGSTTVLNRLSRELHYPNLYIRQVFDTRDPFKQVPKYGWKTTSKTKDKMYGELQPIIKNLEIKFNDLETIKQLMLFAMLENGKTGVAEPEHDDLAIAAMIAYQMSKSVYIDKPQVINQNKPGTWAYEYKKHLTTKRGFR